MPTYPAKAGISRHRLEALEAQRQTVAIRAVLDPTRQVYDPAVEPLQGFEHRAIFLPEQPLGNMQPIVRVDPDQMGVECGVMDFRERDAVGNYRLAKPLVPVRDDVGRIQQQRLKQPRQRAAAVIRANYGFPERCLMQPLLDRTQGVAPFERILGRR